MGSDPVLYFAGCYSKYHDGDGVARAAQDLLEALGCSLLVPEVKCCGAPSLTNGSGKKAMEDAKFNSNILSSYVRKGIPVLTTCPTCALTLQSDYHSMLASEESKLLSGAVYDVAQYLLARFGREAIEIVRGAVKARVAYHSPCHLRARASAEDEAILLAMIPGLELVRLGEKCCGMAGTFGLKKENFELSMRIGESLFKEIESSGADLVATSCPTCALQFKQAGFKNVVHPLNLLEDSILSP